MKVSEKEEEEQTEVDEELGVRASSSQVESSQALQHIYEISAFLLPVG